MHYRTNKGFKSRNCYLVDVNLVNSVSFDFMSKSLSRSERYKSVYFILSIIYILHFGYLHEELESSLKLENTV